MARRETKSPVRALYGPPASVGASVSRPVFPDGAHGHEFDEGVIVGPAVSLPRMIRTLPPSVRSVSGAKVLGKGRGKASRAGQKLSLPPELESTVRVRHTFRFRASSTLSGVNCGAGGIAGALGGTCTVTNSTIRTWASSFRIRLIKVWLPAVAGVDNVFVDWLPNGLAARVPDTSRITTIPDGITSTGVLMFKPPKQSLAAFWIVPGSVTLGDAIIGFSAPAGTIIDIDFEYTLSNVDAAVNQTVTSATLGSAYYLALDGAGTNKIVPVGVPTTS